MYSKFLPARVKYKYLNICMINRKTIDILFWQSENFFPLLLVNKHSTANVSIRHSNMSYYLGFNLPLWISIVVGLPMQDTQVSAKKIQHINFAGAIFIS